MDISFSLSFSGNSSVKASASRTDISVKSMMLMPPTVTASISGLSLLPLHSSQTLIDIKLSIRCRIVSVWV